MTMTGSDLSEALSRDEPSAAPPRPERRRRRPRLPILPVAGGLCLLLLWQLIGSRGALGGSIPTIGARIILSSSRV